MFAVADLNGRVWVAWRRVTRLRSTAAIAIYHPKAVRQHSTHDRSWAGARRDPESCPFACAGPRWRSLLSSCL